MHRYLIFVIILSAEVCSAQKDSLIYKSGRRVAYTNLDEYSDAVKIKNPDEGWITILPDSILGISELLKEREFYCKPNPDSLDLGDYVFVSRLEVGPINLYESKSEKGTLYMESADRFEKVYSTAEPRAIEQKRFEMFRSFVEDDSESVNYITAPKFSFRFKEIVKVVQYYNKRNYVEKDPEQFPLRGTVFLYRTNFQKTKERVRVKAYGESHDLYIKDYIQLEIPIDYPTKFTLSDPYIKNEIILCGKFEDQYYEVLYDKEINGFRFDRKDGSELLYEFSKIYHRVDKKLTED